MPTLQRTALIALLLLPGARAAWADVSAADLDKARAYFNAGAESYDQGKYEVALREFQHAHALSHNPILYFNMAACEEHEQHYQAAALLLRQYLIERSDAEDRAKVESRIKVLEERDDALKRPPGTTPETGHLQEKPPETGKPTASSTTTDKTPGRRFTWVGAGVTAAAAVATVALGVVTMATHSSLQGTCGNTAAGCNEGQIS